MSQDRVTHTVRQIRDELNKDRAHYQEIQTYLQSAKNVRKMLLNLRAALVDVLAYNPMNEPQVAVYVVARAKTELEGFFKDIDFMETFEEKEKQLKDIQKQQADLDGEEDQ